MNLSQKKIWKSEIDKIDVIISDRRFWHIVVLVQDAGAGVKNDSMVSKKLGNIFEMVEIKRRPNITYWLFHWYWCAQTRHKTNYEQKWLPFSNLQLYDSAQTKNIFRFRIVSVLHEKELNWSNKICLDYHKEVKISFENSKSLFIWHKKVFKFSGFDPGSFRSKNAHLTPRPWSQYTLPV